jgi:hypothetical protein
LDEWRTVCNAYPNHDYTAFEHRMQLQHDRTYLGSVMGSLDAWLLLRSLRTLHLRIPLQSATATVLVKWLNSATTIPAGQSFDGIPGAVVTKVWHSSLQTKDVRGFQPAKQMEGGWNATFAIFVSFLVLDDSQFQLALDSSRKRSMQNCYPIR